MARSLQRTADELQESVVIPMKWVQVVQIGGALVVLALAARFVYGMVLWIIGKKKAG